ncbi:hypothetical protein C0Q70_13741 [Pomacea canaliculata]|uniref:Uncharacterized protein n=1 Tax=Pomacea canaliculata TaxID=400727 RepID=A0A2T7NY58_POMCA|nr:uncharacterized protein LOC112570730 isoform X2 [Pomacea canaliculata]PVD26073.1 hypothetical protein C0Q70_13741 [Pomacea canaliculata]
MFHIRHIKVPAHLRNTKHGPLYSFYAASGFGPPNMKENLRRGVLLATVASVLLLVGSLLTWLVFTEVFGNKLPIMGPLVLAVGLLLLALALRQFCLVWKHKRSQARKEKADGARTQRSGEEVEGETEEADAGAVEMETWSHNESSNTPFPQNSYPGCCDPSAGEKLHHQGSGVIGSLPSTMVTTTQTTLMSLPHSTTYQPVSASWIPPPTPTSPIPGTAPEGKVRSCSDLAIMGTPPNPRPVIRYSQGQLQLLDCHAAGAGLGGTAISPSTIASTPSHQSLGERSGSVQEGNSYHSLSLSLERTDVLETI